MRKGIFLLFIIGLGFGMASCGSENAKDSDGSVENSEVNEDPNQEPIDTVKPVEQMQWYAGEEPTDLEKLQLLSAFNSGEKKFDFYAVFTEPFWTFYFFGNEVLFNSAEFDVPEVLPLEYPFSDKEEEQALSFMRNGEFWQFKVKKESGSDGMSELEYPYSVALDLLQGAGSTSMMSGEY
jgi:uncharacterized membrane protein